ncbi:Set3 complex subunit with deacetylase activity, meiotic-specific repressor of sporulation proteins [Aspergillus alliaceus]|uniref:40S ribosomal protein S12 n=3 Tax=Aspergillus subgen. Circumdati TaxID=2720871 RepID=A0A8H6E969_PETAA|nr:Set3 complex subunit with deacetylase activity, meiotic-specific repressor of sporulation proteins [Aspergillus burnettii]
MSDVDAVSSLPAALDAGHSALAVKVNHRSPSGLRSPKRSSPFPARRGEDDRGKEVVPVAGVSEGPPSPKADSEAETIIQSGRESLSPEKRRKYIQHEPKRRDDDDHVDAAESDLPPNDLQVRKRKLMDSDSSDGRDRDPRSLSPRRRIVSPLSIVKVEKPEDSQPFSTRTELSTTSAPRTSRKRSFSETIDGEGDAGRPARPIAASHDQRKDLNSITFPRPVSTDRSASPVRSVHKRTASGPQIGDVQRKKKAPTPLITGYPRQSSEDRQSVSSSTSGSPLPSAHLRKLGSVDGASASPARPMGHKKQRDQNGRTRLARACAAQELETAIARHADRPEDLNVADNAGNTPLQIASLEGCAPIVKFLLDSGCEIDTKNIDKDTPLIDAVENGHLDVVKLLLEAGANPRIVNAEGDEPYDLVPSDSEDYEEIRRVLAHAKANPRPSRRSEERAGSENKETSSRRVSAESVRESPPANRQRSPPFATTTKRKTVRSEATRNDLLWTTATPENLQAFAAKGDIVGVANILNVGQKADPESMIAAAKGGHDEVISLLLGMGDAAPDPDPVQGGSQKPGFNTPMLAAIGRGNLAVIRILLNQPEFNPTRRLYRDRTYFELSRERRAENWEDEYDLLRDAYDNYVRTKKSRKQDVSSPRRARDKDKENKRPGRRDSPSPAGRPRKPNGSPSYRDLASKDVASLKEKRRDNIAYVKEKSSVPRPRPAHSAGTEPDISRPDSRVKQPLSSKDGESSAASRGEEAPKRRRLIAGRPPQDRRRPSLHSSDSLSSRDESSKIRVDHSESAMKSGPPPLKRGRSSASPERGRPAEPDRQTRDIIQKKRRVLSEDGTPNITNGGLKKDQALAVGDAKPRRKDDDDHPEPKLDPIRRPEGQSHKAAERKSVKEEQERHDTNGLDDIPMNDDTEQAEAEAEVRRQKEARKAKQERLAEEARLAAEAEKARREKEEEERAAHAARRLAEEKERAAEEERKRKEAEQRRIKQAEDERLKRLEQERLRLAKARREQEEQEQRRRDALPNRLRIAANLVGSNDPQAKNHLWLKKFMPVVTAETRQLDPSCAPDVAVEKWVPNYLVAPLLATNDLQLAQYSSWEKRHATPTQRMNLWRVTRRMLVQADDAEFMNSSFGQVMQKDSETRPKYFDMEHVFWVKLSDFMDLVPHIPHLHGLDLQFLKMHIDQEPAAPLAFNFPQANGHISGPSHVEDTAGLPNGVKGLTNGYGHRPNKMSDGEETVSNPVAAADEVEVSADAGAGGQMSVLDALKGVLRISLIHDGLARGLREAAKALDRRQAHMCVLNEGCEEEAYKKLVIALCSEHKIPLIKVPDGKMLGEWVGLCQLDREGNARKVVNCSCVVVKDWGEESQERSVLLNYFQTEQ